MTIISLVAAMSQNRVIGQNNKLPWHIPEELQHFKKLTLGKPIIMGRKTFDSIGRRLLPGRQTIVLTREKDLNGEGFAVANTVEEALEASGNAAEIMIVGGAGVYNEFLPIAHRIYLSVIPHEYEGDTFFPQLDATWHLVSKQEHDKFSVEVFER